MYWKQTRDIWNKFLLRLNSQGCWRKPISNFADSVEYQAVTQQKLMKLKNGQEPTWIFITLVLNNAAADAENDEQAKQKYDHNGDRNPPVRPNFRGNS